MNDNTKDGQKVTTTRDDRPGAPMGRVRPTPEARPAEPRENGQQATRPAGVRPPQAQQQPGGQAGGLTFSPSPSPTTGDTETTTRSKKKPASETTRAPRKAHLVLRRIEPWSAMKFSFVVALVCFVILFVAVAVLYGVLSALGVFDSIVNTINQITNGDQTAAASGLDASTWFDPVRILGFTALIGAINVVLITALCTLGAVIYNIAADVVGGVEVTFSEAE
ncbi:hypothetical protein HNP84_000193 [Thermocatellispora tengchongensis]|uniref:DUF3566 domain-containing protein n=1 Tax=Thermocatellispora tengchongensis TaxID=1073253 RepID=A0A840P383_9ACTN|nr:DUF3566 domain-containing protein [Thermocatellispora tengchongensis]MBB5130505.1 hypothetical protein [Thermocatellispora tengchongensis]